MQKRLRSFHVIAFATFAVCAGFAGADDATSAKAEASPTPAKAAQTTAPAKPTVAADPVKADDKSAKQDAASAGKADLFTLASKLNFYGEAQAGVYASTLKSAGAAKTQHATGDYYNLMFGTDIKLTNNVTMGIQVQSGRGLTTFH